MRPARSDSVRSDLLRPAREAEKSDDLKRIRGVGVLIEKRLNALGVDDLQRHVANWTSGDIDRISQTLDFKGRIERENWVEQARILSSGGHTEFSRRVDRGDVESSTRSRKTADAAPPTHPNQKGRQSMPAFFVFDMTRT